MQKPAKFSSRWVVKFDPFTENLHRWRVAVPIFVAAVVPILSGLGLITNLERPEVSVQNTITCQSEANGVTDWD